MASKIAKKIYELKNVKIVFIMCVLLTSDIEIHSEHTAIDMFDSEWAFEPFILYLLNLLFETFLKVLEIKSFTFAGSSY